MYGRLAPWLCQLLVPQDPPQVAVFYGVAEALDQGADPCGKVVLGRLPDRRGCCCLGARDGQAASRQRLRVRVPREIAENAWRASGRRTWSEGIRIFQPWRVYMTASWVMCAQ